MLRLRSLAVFTALLASFVTVGYAHAQGQGFRPPPNPGLPVTDLPSGIAGIIRVALLLVGVLALGFVVYGGFVYITSRGDEREVESAKATITKAVTGIVVIGLAYALVEFVFCAVGGIGPFCP